MDYAKAADYLRRPYARVLIPDEESGTYSAKILEFPGCVAQGASPAEAYERLEAVAESWIEAALEMQQEIPSPFVDIQASGRFALRLTRSLHRQVIQLAELEGTSLNTFIASTLAEKVGALSFYKSLSQQMAADIVRHAPLTDRLPGSRNPARNDDRPRPQDKLMNEALRRPLHQDN